MNEEKILDHNPYIGKCNHFWEKFSSNMITSLEEKTWMISNYQCKLCFSLKQTKERFR